MFRRRLARACASSGLLALATAACGAGDQPTADEPTVTTAQSTSAAPNSTPSTPSAPATSATPTTAAVRTIEVTFANGQVLGGTRRETVRLGERVRLRVTSDVADEVHVHTYDAKVPVAEGQTVELEVTVTIPGRHEVELEKKRKQLLTLEVR